MGKKLGDDDNSLGISWRPAQRGDDSGIWFQLNPKDLAHGMRKIRTNPRQSLKEMAASVKRIDKKKK